MTKTTQAIIDAETRIAEAIKDFTKATRRRVARVDVYDLGDQYEIDLKLQDLPRKKRA